MNQKMKKKKVFIIYYILIFLILAISGIITYSNYSSTLVTDAIVDVAKWKINVNSENASYTANLSDYITSKIYTDNGDTVVVPGTSGMIEMELDFSEMNVTTSYTITIDSENSSLPENLVLYTDSNYTTQFSSYSGTSNLNSTTVTRYIYWKWNYTTTDETANWMDKEIKLTLDVDVTQRVD